MSTARLDARPEVIAFARLMEQKLRENEHKGWWKNDDPGPLLLRAFEELAELSREVLRYEGSQRSGAFERAVAREGADVANMVMMVLDVCGALAWSDQEE